MLHQENRKHRENVVKETMGEIIPVRKQSKLKIAKSGECKIHSCTTLEHKKKQDLRGSEK